MLELRKFVAPEFVFGAGAAGMAGRYARNHGGRVALLVADEGIRSAGWAAQVEESLAEAGLRVIHFSDVSSNPRDVEVMRGVEVYARNACDCLVAVGGGSVMDCAKGIGISHANQRHVLEFEGVDNVDRPGPPLVCIPTTAGSSADVSQFAIINDTQRRVKIAIVSKTVVPDAALIDPIPTTTMGEELTAHTGLDALTHAVEAYVSNAASPMTDLYALEAVRLISANLEGAVNKPRDLEVRGRMTLGSMYAGLAFSNAILGAVHAMAHSLGGFLDLPHGMCNAILLDHVMAYNYESSPERFLNLARAMGADIPAGTPAEEAREAALEPARGLKRLAGVTQSLGDLGVRPEDVAHLASMAAQDPCLLTNPRAADEAAIARIYEQAL
ncbi:alcohol dehydrogenase-like regulatory protein ErcA [Desulfohalovibrio reitneri]|uniref:alcohol dehydrogenase-like regulatory protein ErcA n=1 Tax=Desulfohalovibrio reitneri TaxID=1307759 RepID=UPI0004A6E7D0|nr:alcohol dehydrogenase-like regulatory protein ErcA [Desulfohalovibrio reitneri]